MDVVLLLVLSVGDYNDKKCVRTVLDTCGNIRYNLLCSAIIQFYNIVYRQVISIILFVQAGRDVAGGE